MIAPHRVARRGLVGVSLAGAALVGCLSTEESDDDPGMDFSAIAVPGAWRLPSDVHAAGQRQYVRYDGAPAWSGGSNCGSGLGAPARALGDHLRRAFPGSVSSYGGFSCRPNTANTSQTSVHGTGRAIDVFIPTTGGQADNTRGDVVANWLVTNAQRLGVQYIIWDRTQWNASRSGDKVSPYGGPHPHHDHLHVELNTSARPIESCTAHCEAGDVIVDTNCGRGDCNAFGARCVSDGLGTRCVFGTCPAVGSATICVNDRTLATCSNGAVRTGDCGAFAAWCSTAGRARTEARCVSAFCVSGPSERPVAHTACWIEGGQLLRCDANGGATPTACPAGQACSVIGGTARCAPRVCPATGESDICVDGRYIAHCYGGSVGRATDCRAMGRVCSASGSGGPRCVVPAVDAGAVDVVVADGDGVDPPIDDEDDAGAPTDDAGDVDAGPADAGASGADATGVGADAADRADVTDTADAGEVLTEATVEGGCSCRAGAPRSARGGAWAIVGLALLAVSARPRRRDEHDRPR
ncbi:MAG: hypothetical protein Q8S73_00390 [Deltaproteobacteria bacterium]|nr:hypothetical protein [Myxococcales bacterium]MDP3212530.1 hypothetical protein [Deltaproteobacteria bacterium]